MTRHHAEGSRNDLPAAKRPARDGAGLPPALRLCPIAAAVIAALNIGNVEAANSTWIGPNGRFWDETTNWSPRPPAAGDDVVLGAFDTTFRMNALTVNSFFGTGVLSITGGSLGATSASGTGGLVMSGGTLGGAGTVTVSGLATLTGGEQTGTGTSQFNGNVAINGNGERILSSGRIMNTAAVTNWTGNSSLNGNDIRFDGNATINNTGTWNDSNTFGTYLGYGFSGNKVFNNTGSYNKTGNATTDLYTAFNNTGTVSVTAGRLNLVGNVDSISTGTFNIAAGSTLGFGNGNNSGGVATLSSATFGGTGTLLIDASNFSGADVRMVGDMSHAGTLAIANGTLQVDGSFAAPLYSQTGGQLGGAGTVTISGLAALTGGEQTGTGTSQFNGNVAINGNGERILSSGRIMNTAAVTNWTGNSSLNGNDIRFDGNATINNTGTWNDSNTFGTYLGYGFSGNKVFNNTGSYNKTGNATTDLYTAFNNTGTVSVTAGEMRFNNGTQGTGTLQNSGTGVITLATSNVTSSTGILRLASSTTPNLNLGTNNIVVSRDYDNLAFGTGNSFNKRANVDGTGLINGSNVAQAITGATVTNGSNATANLTINNVRVGSTTYNYQVANTGTGAALRGAIQPGANGGVISDSRLSGSGVSEGSFGPIAAGGSSGNYAVTFTAANAGALGPLTGTNIVHIANNFANVPEQNLVLSIGAGAAAYNAAVGNATPSPSVALGNTRVGGSLGQTFTVSNTQAPGAYSEDLNASFGASTGNASGAGTIAGLVAGASNNSAMRASLGTSSAGAKTGTVTFDYATAGTVNGVSNGLGTLGVGSQTVALSGNVYQTAAGTLLTAPVDFGTVQVGQSVSRQLSIQNSATGPTGFVEDLNARFGTTSGTNGNLIVGSGSIGGLAAGAIGNGLSVGLNTGAAGVLNGSIGINFFSAGTVGGVSNGLGELPVGSTGLGVSGEIVGTGIIVNQASPLVNNGTIALGNVRIGSASPTANVSVTNQATAAPQAALNASISGNGPVTASGGFNLLAPGSTNASSLAVGFDTSTAGGKNGTATIAFVSDASNIGNCAPNCQLAIGSQDVAVTGAVYRLANPTATPSTVTVAGRVGSVAPTTAITINNASPDLYTEGLNATRGATSSGFTSSGAIANLSAGGSSSAIGVTLDTATAGTFGGTQVLNYVSTGAGTTGAADLALGSGTVALNGKVYTPAAATVNTPSVDFGIVHVGDGVSLGVSVTNSAAVTALNDTLVASSLGATGAFTAGGNLGSGLAAQQTSSALTVGLNTAVAGTYSGSAAFRAASHDADLSDAALADLAVSLSGTVNNYAADGFMFGSGAGTLTRSGSTFVLDYGTVLQGAGLFGTTLLAGNTATGPADLLDGSFRFDDPADFGESGFTSFFDLLAGQTSGPLRLAFDASTVGSFVDAITLHGFGHNASGYSGALGDLQLIVRGTVVAQPGTVPEPGSLALLGLGASLLFLRRGRARRPTRASRIADRCPGVRPC